MTKSFYNTYHAWLLIYPQYLNCDWAWGSFKLVTSYRDRRNLGSVLLYGTIVALVYYSLFSRRLTQRVRQQLCMATLWLVIPFLPSCQFFLTVGFVVAERVLYLPSVGFCLFFVVLLDWLVERLQNDTATTSENATNDDSQAKAKKPFSGSVIVVVSVVLLIVGLYSIRTIERNKDWATPLALFSAGIEVAPNNAQLHYMAARHMTLDKQLIHFKKAAMLEPTYVDAFINWGVALSIAQRNEEAIAAYEGALKSFFMRPNMDTTYSLIQKNKGLAEWSIGRAEAARHSFSQCLKAEPGNAECQRRFTELQGGS